MSEQSRTLFVIGHGGHAHVIGCAARALGWNIRFLVQSEKVSQDSYGQDHLVNEAEFLKHPPAGDGWGLICGVGSVGPMAPRGRVLANYATLRDRFVSIVHPSARVDATAKLAPGVFVATGAVVANSVLLMPHAIVNSGVIIDHDSTIGPNSHIATGAVLAGHVAVGSDVFIGAGTTIIQDIRIGDDVMVGAGSLCLTSLSSGSGTWFGSPAVQRKG